MVRTRISRGSSGTRADFIASMNSTRAGNLQAMNGWKNGVRSAVVGERCDDTGAA